MSLNDLIHTATILRLTLRVDMRAADPRAGHAISSDFANSLFQDYFTAAFPGRCSDLRIIPVKYERLSTVVSQIRKEANTSNLCFVLLMNTKYPITESGLNPCGYHTALRVQLPRPTNPQYIGAVRNSKFALHMSLP
jgi:hypothetical protein